MYWDIRFFYPVVLYSGLPLLCVSLWYRWNYYTSPSYCYSLTSTVKANQAKKMFNYKAIISGIRFVSLIGLVFLIARPQLVDQTSKVIVNGIDIMMVLDVSGSMQLYDDRNDDRTRIDIAKEEAIKFVDKRNNDPVGLVFFANEAVSRCPLTLDKEIIKTIIKNTELGVIDPGGTMISKGLVMALNRLKKSESKSKIVILLTDGEPTQGDLNPRAVVELAKKYGIKLYTIGIGGSESYIKDPVFGNRRVHSPLNTRLLSLLATGSGGKFFHARKSQDLSAIYDEIDLLEKTEKETDVYHNFYDIYLPFLWLVIGILFIELFFARYIWFGL